MCVPDLSPLQANEVYVLYMLGWLEFVARWWVATFAEALYVALSCTAMHSCSHSLSSCSKRSQATDEGRRDDTAFPSFVLAFGAL